MYKMCEYFEHCQYFFTISYTSGTTVVFTHLTLNVTKFYGGWLTAGPVVDSFILAAPWLWALYR